VSELSPAPEHARFGSGWISGILSAVLGIMSFGAVLCLHFPALLTSPILRQYYPMPFMRALIQTVLLLSFALGALSLILRRRKVLGTVGLSFATLAALMGGAGVEVRGPVPGSNYLGLDWFLLDLFLMGLIFVPMERLFALSRTQPIFRKGWRTDLSYFLTSHIGVQMLTLVTMAPAAILFRWMIDSPIQRTVGSQPWWLQFLEIIVLADLCGYWIHRAFHRVPLLWRFHAIHHSSERMDWLAGSRLHLVDIVVTRALAFIPLYALGFSTTPVYFYLALVSFHAVFVHANVGVRFGGLRHVIGTPQYHHWHHAVEPIDKNFAIHLPVIDRIFGTLHLPKDKWPERYGIAGRPVPEGWAKQFTWPLRGPAK
jgi:sterol desaturase/sphingolipid hydroxylase (fatty acid hydroxylase superfamily)